MSENGKQDRDLRAECGDCGKPYRYEQDMLSGDFMWLRGKGCKHPFSSVRVFDADGSELQASVKR